jgi:hypothetical protein
MGTTTNGLPYPASTDAPNGAAQIQALAAAVDAWGSYVDYVPTTGWTNTTVTSAKYNKVGKRVTVEVLLTMSGAPTGTFALTLPSTAAAPGGGGKLAIGDAFFLDTSATTNNQTGQVVLLSSTTATIYATQDATAAIVTATNPIALASGDTIGLTFIYREA